MRHATARLARQLPLLAALLALPSAHGADDVVAEEQPPVAAPQPGVRILPRIRIQMQQMQQAQGQAPVAAEVRREPYLGLVTGPVAEQVRAQLAIPDGIGLAVEAVAKDGPAGRGGVKKFDILRKFDDQLVCTAEQLSALVKAAGKGKEVALTVTRGGKEEVVKVLIDDRQVAVGGPAAPAAGVAGVLPLDLGGLLGEALPDGLPGIGDDVRLQIQRQVQEALDQAEAQAAAGGFGGNAQARVLQIYPGGRSQKVVVNSDQRGTVEIRETDGKRTVTVKDPAGKEVHSGPLDTEADREQVPEAFRGMVGEVEGRLGGGAKPAQKSAEKPADDDEI
ncbi:MAG: PDZ domain-containing protein [Planctomycetia bacterium]|nr:PDZ domain-containing protein [Planctomycetia bacterium]